jgi:hypothetical protein
MQQADITLVEAIATQQKDMAIQSTLRNEVKDDLKDAIIQGRV